MTDNSPHLSVLRAAAIERLTSWLKTWSDDDRRAIAKAIMPVWKQRPVPVVPVVVDPTLEPPDTIPLRGAVEVATVKGIRCRAVLAGKHRYLRGPDKYGPRRVHCRRVDRAVNSDLMVVGWKYILENELKEFAG